MLVKNLNTFIKFLRLTPVHPQFLLNKHERERYQLIRDTVNGEILDIGCGNKHISKWLKPSVEYLSFDHPKVGKLYKTTPDVFGTAENLPFKSGTFDCILLLEVLEHIPDPEQALQSIHSILRENGTLVVSVPFLYPLHDVPYDFQRWTEYGLEKIFSKCGFKISEMYRNGTAIEVAAILNNLAYSWSYKNMNNCLKILLSPVLLLLILTNNGLGSLLRALTSSDKRFPISYMYIVRKV